MTTSPPLWQQLLLTSQALLSVLQGTSATVALEAVHSDLRPGVQALLFHVLRGLGQAQCLRALLAPKLPAPEVDALLCVALALCGNQDHALYDGFTLVNQTVEASKRSPKLRRHAAFFNGCLRRYLREQPEMLEQIKRQDLAQWNYPTWWVEKVRADYPENWQAILHAGNQQPALTLRVNIQHHKVEAYQQILLESGIDAVRNGEFGVSLSQALPVIKLPGFEKGWASVQDAAAQLAAPLLLKACRGLGLSGSLNILDACAAPGGKTAHLLELQSGKVTALEIDPNRAKRIQDNLCRLGLQADVLVGDASKPSSWWKGEGFDAILLDAPCTASGIVRRHPDIRWLRRELDIVQMAKLQTELLTKLWPLLKPGGCLMYCTCSVFKQEGQQPIESFLENNNSARLLASPGHLISKTLSAQSKLSQNAVIDHDGFYYAILHKPAE